MNANQATLTQVEVRLAARRAEMFREQLLRRQTAPLFDLMPPLNQAQGSVGLVVRIAYAGLAFGGVPPNPAKDAPPRPQTRANSPARIRAVRAA